MSSNNLLPSVKPEFFSTPHAWEVEEEEITQTKKPKPRPRKKSPYKHHHQKKNTAITLQGLKSTSGKPVLEGKVKKEIYLHDLESRRKESAERFAQSSHTEHIPAQQLQKSCKSLEKSQRAELMPKPNRAPEMPKHSLFNEDDWAEAPLDGQVEFDFSELPRWD